MSNHYAISLLVEQHHAELRDEAAQDRLARLTRAGRPRRPRWWERLKLSRAAAPAGPQTRTEAAARRVSHRPTATVAAGDSPC